MTINRTIAFGVIILAALLVAALSLTLVSLQEAPMNPGGGSVVRSTPPPPERKIPLAGNILSITPEKREMTIGTYRVENNKAVLADQKTIRYTSETSFVREVAPLGGKATTAKISDRDVKIGDTVFITPGAHRLDDQIIAVEVSIITPPPPGR